LTDQAGEALALGRFVVDDENLAALGLVASDSAHGTLTTDISGRLIQE
jgi:hypothetical protein